MQPVPSPASVVGCETNTAMNHRPASRLQSQPSLGRLPSLTEESYSALNMSNMNNALPAYGMHQRVLPIPPVTQDQPQPILSTTHLPEIRPLRSEPKPNSRGLPSHSSLTWGTEYTTVPSTTMPVTCFDTTESFTQTNMLPPTTSLAEGPFGFPYHEMQFPTTSGSPDISPTTVHHSSDSSTTTSITQSDNRYQGNALPPIYTELPSDPVCKTLTGQYSINITHNDITHGATYTSGPTEGSMSATYQWPTRMSARQSYNYAGPSSYEVADTQSTRDEAFHTINGAAALPVKTSQNASSLHQPKPQPPRTASIEALCREPSHDQTESPRPTHPKHDRHRHGADQESRERHGNRAQSSSSKKKYAAVASI